MAETEVTVDTPLDEVLAQSWQKIVVDAGSRGNLSTHVGEGMLCILVDPAIPLELDYGGNRVSDKGRVVAVPDTVATLPSALDQKVDRVQIIAPDPREMPQMVYDSDRLPKSGGKIVVVLDTTSNYAHLANGAIREVKDYYDGPNSDYRVRSQIAPVGANLNQLVGGKLNTELIPGDAKILILERK